MSGQERLPAVFREQMKMMLQEEANLFFTSFNDVKCAGLRANGLKLGMADLRNLRGAAGLTEEDIQWAENGAYVSEEAKPGKHPYYYLGLYYVQEPSAMLPAELLGVDPGHRVLDLCAAPGGKSTQLAAKLRGDGVLVSNDNASERTKALAKNIELAGATNVIVLNEEPGRIAEKFGAWFDRVLVDAPCSGEGMFRKDESMIQAWERHSVERCSVMQADIMRDAARLVAPGGRLLYSTCTFSPRENEGTIARFLAAFPEFEVVPVKLDHGFGPGRPDWLNESETRGLSAARVASLAGTVRVWPHRSRGEGHFAALLERKGPSEKAPRQDAAGWRTHTTCPTREDGDSALFCGTSPYPLRSEAEGVPGDSGHTSRYPLRSGGELLLNGRDNATSRKKDQHPKTRSRPASANDRKSVGRGGKTRDSQTEQPSRQETLAKFAEFVADNLREWDIVHNEKNGITGWRRSTSSQGEKTSTADAERELSFRGTSTSADAEWGLSVRGTSVYAVPFGIPDLEGLAIVRPGWLLGSATKHRFQPSQAMAMGLVPGDAVRCLRLTSDTPDTIRYLKGETLQPSPSAIVGADGTQPASGKGWTLVCVDGFPAGWGRWDGSVLKNERLPGWRWI